MTEPAWKQTDAHGIHDAGHWEIWRDQTRVTASIADCGCCGPIDVAAASTIDEWDREWARIGAMLRPHVQDALDQEP